MSSLNSPQKGHGWCQRSQEMSHDFLINAGWNIIPKKHGQSEQECFAIVAITTVQGEPTFDYDAFQFIPVLDKLILTEEDWNLQISIQCLNT